MSSITTGGKTTTYAYDADGIRTTKVVGGVTHEYLTLNGKVVYEKIGTGGTAKIMVFTYDAQGRPFAVKYSKNNGESFTNYFYALNLQGDVVKIFRPNAVKDADGTTIGYTERTYATYSYNAWGELTGITDSNGNSILNKQTTSTALANLNPLRYRGYYYDNETGFYYLQSRYYDPANHRFINADSYASTGQGVLGCNMFAYCNNRSVSIADYAGNYPVDTLEIGMCLKTEGYSSATAAAKAFATAWYGISLYVRHEFGTLIYEKTEGDRVTYGYAPPVNGLCHKCNPLMAKIPYGTRAVASVHTHINSCDYSDKDMVFAAKNQLFDYLVGPDFELHVYCFDTNNTFSCGYIDPIPVFDEKKPYWVELFRESWMDHLYDCEFGCWNVNWPTE